MLVLKDVLRPHLKPGSSGGGHSGRFYKIRRKNVKIKIIIKQKLSIW